MILERYGGEDTRDLGCDVHTACSDPRCAFRSWLSQERARPNTPPRPVPPRNRHERRRQAVLERSRAYLSSLTERVK